MQDFGVVWRLIEIGVLVVAAWPAIRLCGCPPVVRAFPQLAILMAVGLAAYAAAIYAVTATAPVLLGPLAVLTALACLSERWRARPAYGAGRRLPPGSLALAPLAPWRDHRFYEKQVAAHGPVFKTSNFVHPTACVVGLEPTVSVLRRHDAALGNPGPPYNRLVPRGVLRYMTPADRSSYRKVLASAFSPAVIEDCAPLLAGMVRNTLDRFATDSLRGVEVRPHLEQLVLNSFIRLFFGLEVESDPAHELATVYARIHVRTRVMLLGRRTRRAVSEAEAIVTQQAARLLRLLQDGEEPPPSFLASLLHDQPEATADLTVLRNLVFLVKTSAGDVAALLHWLLQMLAENPHWADLARGQDATHDLPERIVRETLRLEQSEYLYRTTLQPIEIGEFVVPRGWLVRFCIRESHRDGAVFPNPHIFDPDRFQDRSYSTREYAPFGASRISCLGDHLTLTLGRILVEELVRGFTLELAAPSTRTFDGWHWRPSTRFRFTPRVAAVSL